MSIRLKLQWYLFAQLSVLTLSGAGVLRLVDTPVQHMRLRPGEKVHVQVYRPFPCPLSMQLRVTLDGGPAHVLEKNQSDEAQASFRVSAYGQDRTWAIRRPHGFGPQHATFWLGAQDGTGLLLDAFCTDVTLSVLSVTESVAGRDCDLYVSSPVPFKFTPHGAYRFFWWFHFWPLNTALLSGYLVLLIVQTRKQKKRA